MKLESVMGKVDPYKKKFDIKNVLTPDRILAQMKFAKKHDLRTIIDEAWGEVSETKSPSPEYMYEKLLQELYEEYGNMKGEDDLLRDLMKQDAIRHIKNFS